MNIVDECRELLKYSAARSPLLVVPQSRFDEFMQATCDTGFDRPLVDENFRFDGVLVRCVRGATGNPQVVDLAP